MINVDDIVPLMTFEWIKGDKLGSTEIVKDLEVSGDFAWINFEGGGRINGHVINEMMAHIGFVEKKDVDSILLHKETNINSESIVQNTVIPSVNIQESRNTFGFDILDKAKRDSNMQLDLSINFDFISDNKIEMLLELYGQELFESLKLYIREQLSDDIITSCIESYLLDKFDSPKVDEVNKQTTLDI